MGEDQDGDYASTGGPSQARGGDRIDNAVCGAVCSGPPVSRAVPARAVSGPDTEGDPIRDRAETRLVASLGPRWSLGLALGLFTLLGATVADAHPPVALIGNFLDGTISVISTTEPGAPTAVTVTATIPISGAPMAGIATNPVRTEAYVAALDAFGFSVLTVIGTDPL